MTVYRNGIGHLKRKPSGMDNRAMRRSHMISEVRALAKAAGTPAPGILDLSWKKLKEKLKSLRTLVAA